MSRIVFFDGSRAYWCWPGLPETRTRVAEPGTYIFTDEGVQLFRSDWHGAALHWPDDLASAGEHLARWLRAELVADRAEYDRRKGEETP